MGDSEEIKETVGTVANDVTDTALSVGLGIITLSLVKKGIDYMTKED